ncbi:MAG TPA: GGDEF domain-containing protein [Dissulfurispiraceae bacterium]
MPRGRRIEGVLQRLSSDLRSFIELSLQESDDSWRKWMYSELSDVQVKCWERKSCNKKECPAYMNTYGRCWLIAGTMCGDKIQGKFALKYKSCTECDVYQETVFKDPVSEIYEHLIALIHSLRSKQEELKTMATKDVLTGLYNRNYFEMVMPLEVEKVKRYGGKMSIAMIDVDKFKQINDTYGHLHGDGVLRECALILGKSIRSSDLLVRFGGDEFLIVMPETDCTEKDALIARINENIAAWNGEYASSDYRLSLSIGCAVLEGGKALTEVIEEADGRMYNNKARSNTTLS